jgi:hypothetical protein
MIGSLSMESQAIAAPSAIGHNLSSITSFSDCGKHAGSPLLVPHASSAPAATYEGVDAHGVPLGTNVKQTRDDGRVDWSADAPSPFKVTFCSPPDAGSGGRNRIDVQAQNCLNTIC